MMSSLSLPLCEVNRGYTSGEPTIEDRKSQHKQLNKKGVRTMASVPNIQDEMDRLEELNVFYAAVLLR